MSRRRLIAAITLVAAGVLVGAPVAGDAASPSRQTGPSPEDWLAMSAGYDRSRETDALVHLSFDDATLVPLVADVAALEPRFAELLDGAALTALSSQGRVDRALVLDGADDSVLLAGPLLPTATGQEIAVGAWVRPDTVLPPRQYAVSTWSDLSIGSRSFALGLEGDRAWFSISTDGSNEHAVIGASSLPLDWAHVAGTFDGVTLRVFVDGQLDGELLVAAPGAPVPIFVPLGADLEVGRPSSVSMGLPLDGMVDEVLVYPVARTRLTRSYRVHAPSVVEIDGAFSVRVVSTSDLGGPVTDEDATVGLASPDGAFQFVTPETSFTPGSGGGVLEVDGVTCGEAGVKRFSAEVLGEDIMVWSNPVVCVDDTIPIDGLYWGDMHWHSNLGWDNALKPHAEGSPAEGYSYARDVSALDFSAMAEHAFRLKNPTQDWQTMAAIANQLHEPGAFVTILGHEWRGGDPSSPSGPWGHHIVRFPGFDPGAVTDVTVETAEEMLYEVGVNIPPLAYPGAQYIASILEEEPNPWAVEDPEVPDTRDIWTLWSLVAPFHATITPHHLGDHSGFDALGSTPEEATPYLEIYSHWGSSETYDNRRSTNAQVSGRLAADILLRGFKLGVVGGSDSHKTRPGETSPELHYNLQYKQPGLTGCWAPALTRKAIWQALTQRGCYATSSERILIMFSANGRKMGEELVLPAGTELELEVVVAGMAPIRVELLKDELVLYETSYSGTEITGFTVLDTATSESSFYRVRVTESSGERAWSSPIWVSPDRPLFEDGFETGDTSAWSTPR